MTGARTLKVEHGRPRGRTPIDLAAIAMNPLRSLETMIANLVEGTFGRVFRSEVRPMEIARKLTREMDEHRTQSVSRVYAPNEYAVWLSPPDRERYEGVEDELIDELCAYLLEHARREDLMLASPPLITFHTDAELALGEFGIETSPVARPDVAAARSEQEAPEGEAESGEWLAPDSAAPPAGPPPAGADAEREERGQTMIYSSSARVREPLAQARARRSPRALLVLGGRRLLVPPSGGVLGRSRECDIVVDDASVSRRHAELVPAGDGWTLRDLGSTNGVRVNDRPLQPRQVLEPGDRIALGSAEIVFELR